MTRVLVVDNYDSFTYNLVQYLGELGAEIEVVRNDVADRRRPARPHLGPRRRLARALHAGRSGYLDRGRCDASPRPACRRSASASATSRWRQAFGGQVIRHVPVHGKTTEIEHDGAGLFAGLPNPLTVGRYHSLVVARPTCRRCSRRPPGAAGC